MGTVYFRGVPTNPSLLCPPQSERPAPNPTVALPYPVAPKQAANPLLAVAGISDKDEEQTFRQTDVNSRLGCLVALACAPGPEQGLTF